MLKSALLVVLDFPVFGPFCSGFFFFESSLEPSVFQAHEGVSRGRPRRRLAGHR